MVIAVNADITGNGLATAMRPSWPWISTRSERQLLDSVFSHLNGKGNSRSDATNRRSGEEALDRAPGKVIKDLLKNDPKYKNLKLLELA